MINKTTTEVNVSKTGLNSLSALAVAKIVKEAEMKAASNTIGIGTHDVDMLVHISGTITKGSDFEQVIHMKCDHWALIACLMSKINGITLEAVVREALELPEATVTAVKESATAAIDLLKVCKGTTTCSGKVTTKLIAEQVVTMAEKSEMEIPEPV